MIDQAFNDLMALPQEWLDRIDVQPTTGCWIWTGATRKGYARWGPRGELKTVHKEIYQMLRGPIPAGFDLHHEECGNRACQNPSHLRPLPHVIHSKITRAAVGHGGDYEGLKEVCPEGHAYSEENTYRTPSGSRKCRICRRDQSRNWINANRILRRKRQNDAYYLKKEAI